MKNTVPPKKHARKLRKVWCSSVSLQLLLPVLLNPPDCNLPILATTDPFLWKGKNAAHTGSDLPGSDEDYRTGAGTGGGAGSTGKPVEKDDICMEILMEG